MKQIVVKAFNYKNQNSKYINKNRIHLSKIYILYILYFYSRPSLSKKEEEYFVSNI